MKIRVIIIITVVAALVAAIFGISKKSTYTDVTSGEDSVGQIEISLMQDGMIDIVGGEGYEEAVMEETTMILKVVAEDGLQFEFLHTTQPATVEEVFMGEGVEPGEQITILKDSSGEVFFLGGKCEMNMGFVNAMEPGEEYLVYLSDEVEGVERATRRVFKVSDLVVAPVFLYGERDDILPSENGVMSSSVPYGTVSSNEFFAQTEAGLSCLRTFKEHMMEGYK